MSRIAMWILVLCLLVSKSADAQQRFASKEPGNVFYDTQSVRFTLSDSKDKVHVRIVSAIETTVKEGDYPERDINIGKLPWGWYRIVQGAGEFSGGTPFAVVPRPRQKEEGWVATDVALSWLVKPEQFETVSELAHRAGFMWVRDRLSWSEIEPIKGKFLWGKYEKSLQAQHSKGLNVVQVFHDTPKWARSDENTHAFPDDLRDAYRSAREMAKHLGGVRAWEIWNEADIPMFSTEPASEYAAFFKAAALGIKSGNGSAQVLQTSIALDSPLFTASLAANGTAAYYDIFNYHTYEAPSNYLQRANLHKKYREKAEALNKPVWLTEAGAPVVQKSGTLTFAETVEQAKYVLKSYVESRRAGTTRHFFFILPPFVENNASFGALDRDLLPLPAYSALATAANFLGNATYKGEIRYRQPGLHIHVFDDGTNDVLVGWTDKGDMLLPLPLSEEARGKLRFTELINAFGSPIPLPAEKDKTPALPLSTLPVLLALPRGIMADVTAPASDAPKKPEPPKKKVERPEIIVRLRPLDSKASKSDEAFKISRGLSVILYIEVYNFGGNLSDATLRLSSDSTGVKLVRTSFPIERIKEMDRLVFKVEVSLDASTPRASVTAQVVGANGERSSPAVVDLISE